MAVAQARQEASVVERLPGRTTTGAIRLVVTAGKSRVETSVREPTECLAMKRPGKPDTGNPFVRFDEERSGSAELTTTVGSTRLLLLRLLYRRAGRELLKPSGRGR